MHKTSDAASYPSAGVAPSQTRQELDQHPLIPKMPSPNSQHPRVDLSVKEDVLRFGPAFRSSHPQPTSSSSSEEAVAFASSSGSSHHALNLARALFGLHLDGSRSLCAVPSQQDPYYLDELAPDPCNNCRDTSANLITDNRLASSPSFIDSQSPPENYNYSSQAPLESTFKDRIALLDKNTQKFVQYYGGYQLENKIIVLTHIEQWIANTGRMLIQDVRNEGKKGIKHVICGECSRKFASIQKAGEHITSFHWRLCIWKCHIPGCNKSFRRKQECDRHEDSAHGKLSQKKEKRQKKDVKLASIAPSLSPRELLRGPLASRAGRLRRRRPNRQHQPCKTPTTRSSSPAPASPEQPDFELYPHSLPSIRPSTILEYPHHSRHYNHSPVPASAAESSYWTAGSFGGSTTPVTIPLAPAQSRFSANPRTNLRFPQTQGNSSRYGGGESPMPPSYALNGYHPHPFGMPPTSLSLNVSNNSPQYRYHQGAEWEYANGATTTSTISQLPGKQNEAIEDRSRDALFTDWRLWC